jgi:predicted glycosyltransferase
MKRSNKKTGIYYAHYECFGHTSRIMAVGEAVKKRFPDGNLFFVQAGPLQPKARTSQLGHVYPLPGASRDRQYFGDQACMDIIDREMPELFVTEFFPFGGDESRHELIQTLIKAAKKGIVLWAVAGYPLLTGKDNDWREKVLKLYQKVIIFSPPEEKQFMADTFSDPDDRKRYLDFFDRHASRIAFAGYLLPRQEVVTDDTDENLPKPPVPPGACRVAVVRGGGAVYPKVIAEAILASDHLGKGYYLTVVAGPSTTMQEWYLFFTLVRKKKVDNLLLLRAVGDYEGLIQRSDVCVAGAGYHTSVMLLKHRKKAVIIPFEGYGEMTSYEQPARAALLKRMIGADVLSIRGLTANGLTAAVENAAARREVNASIPEGWFTGREFLDQELKGLFGQ